MMGEGVGERGGGEPICQGDVSQLGVSQDSFPPACHSRAFQVIPMVLEPQIQRTRIIEQLLSRTRVQSKELSHPYLSSLLIPSLESMRSSRGL